MRKHLLFAFLVAMAGCAQASWYWPFGSDDAKAKAPRLSELMETASLLIDEASDLAEEGKVDESVEKYRKALAELDRIERENPDRAKTMEFATVRNKRAYVNAAIDSMLLSQVKSNARVVAVSDTTELEKRLAAERKTSAKAAQEPVEGAKPETGAAAREEKPKPEKPEKAAKAAKAEAKPDARPLTKREQVMKDIADGDYAAAEVLIREMLVAKPNGAMALNLKAAMEERQGKLREAENTLDQAIMSNPRNYFAYYNMAMLMLRKDAGNKARARSYYETGRAVGGPEDPQLEALLK